MVARLRLDVQRSEGVSEFPIVRKELFATIAGSVCLPARGTDVVGGKIALFNILVTC